MDLWIYRYININKKGGVAKDFFKGPTREKLGGTKRH